MEKNALLEEEIIFLDAEIEDDDDGAPVGTLFVRQQVQESPKEETALAPAIDETHAEKIVAEELTPEPPIPQPKVVEAAPVGAVKHTDVPAPVVEPKQTEPKATAKLTVQDASAPKKNLVGDNFSQNKVDMSYDYKIDLTQAPQSEPKKAKTPEKKPSPAPKKEISEADIWGTASLTPKKKSPAPKTEELKQEQVKQPATKKTTKKTTPAPKQEEPKQKPEEAKVEAPEAQPAPAKKTRKKAEPKTDANNVEIKNTKEEENKVAKETTKAATPEIKEQVIVEGEGKIHGKFVIKKTDKGHFVYKLYSSNHRVVAIGAQAYEGLSGCKGGINSVMRIAESAHVENQTLKNYETLKFPKWEIYADKKGEFRLRLYASNGQLVATTNDGYLNVASAKKGIEAVARAAAGAAIVRNDDLW